MLCPRALVSWSFDARERDEAAWQQHSLDECMVHLCCNLVSWSFAQGSTPRWHHGSRRWSIAGGKLELGASLLKIKSRTWERASIEGAVPKHFGQHHLDPVGMCLCFFRIGIFFALLIRNFGFVTFPRTEPG
jgi:hypothetical protein